MEPTIDNKQKPQYDQLFMALVKFRGMRITSLSVATKLSRPTIMRILIDPRLATGYDRIKLSEALNVTTRFLDGVIFYNIPSDTKTFGELFVLQERLKKQTQEHFNDVANGR